jgi:hypothetical protein
VDHDRFLVRVVVEDHHLEQATGPVCADDEISALAGDDSCGMANGVQHVFVADAVLSCAVRDVHLDKVALSALVVKVALSKAVAISVGLLRFVAAGSGVTACRVCWRGGAGGGEEFGEFGVHVVVGAAVGASLGRDRECAIQVAAVAAGPREDARDCVGALFEV